MNLLGYLLGTQSCQIFMGSKDALQKLQFLGAIKEVASLGNFTQNESSGNPAQIRPSPKQKRSECQCSSYSKSP